MSDLKNPRAEIAVSTDLDWKSRYEALKRELYAYLHALRPALPAHLDHPICPADLEEVVAEYLTNKAVADEVLSTEVEGYGLMLSPRGWPPFFDGERQVEGGCPDKLEPAEAHHDPSADHLKERGWSEAQVQDTAKQLEKEIDNHVLDELKELLK